MSDLRLVFHDRLIGAYLHNYRWEGGAAAFDSNVARRVRKVVQAEKLEAIEHPRQGYERGLLGKLGLELACRPDIPGLARDVGRGRRVLAARGAWHRGVILRLLPGAGD